jgi:hypothetical protein
MAIESLIIRDSGGTEADVTASNALKVDGSAVTQPVDVVAPLPAGTNNIGKVRLTDGIHDSAIDVYGGLLVSPIEIESINNTSTTPLGISATFTGTADVNNLPDVMVSCITDQAGTLFFDFSVDGTNWNTFPTAGFTLVAGVHEFHTAVKGSRQFRVRLVNGVLAQSYLRLYVYYGVYRQGNAPISQAIGGDSDAIVTHSVITGLTTGGGGAYIDVKVTPSGAMVTETTLGAGTNNIGDVDVLSMPAITGSVTANAGTNLNTSALALESGGNLASINTKTPALGQATMANSSPVVIASNQSAVPVSFAAASVLFRGRSGTFRTLGRAGTAGQKLMAIHNATGSPVTVTLNKIVVDMWQTVVKAVTVAPPIVRIWKFTAVPTNGNTITKNKIGGTSTSNAAVTVWNDSSADGTGSATTLTITLPAGTILDQLVCQRIITAVGEVNVSPRTFEYSAGITLEALEGVCVFLDYTLATQNPVTDMWVASMEWTEV